VCLSLSTLDCRRVVAPSMLTDPSQHSNRQKAPRSRGWKPGASGIVLHHDQHKGVNQYTRCAWSGAHIESSWSDQLVAVSSRSTVPTRKRREAVGPMRCSSAIHILGTAAALCLGLVQAYLVAACNRHVNVSSWGCLYITGMSE